MLTIRYSTRFKKDYKFVLVAVRYVTDRIGNNTKCYGICDEQVNSGGNSRI